ncbi:tetracycline resistance MFS efflux pump [Nostoc sp. 3335mG]|nr:tetracycline resistance MFS efflux pump [Nostoc sp. 3335mG]
MSRLKQTRTVIRPAAPPDPARAARFVAATIFIDAIGFGIVLPVMPALVMKLDHGTLSDATRIGGWLWQVYAAMQFLCGPLVGGLGDRFGRRPVLLGALGGLAIDYAIVGFSPSIGWLFLGRFLAGIFGASYGPAMAALADISSEEDRAKMFGWIGAAFGIGFVVGPAIGGLLGALGPRAPFYAAAALAACNFLYGLTVFPETLPPDRRRPLNIRRLNPLGALRALGHAGTVMPLLVAYFFWQLAGMVYPVTWAYYAIASFGWSSTLVGVSLALAGIGMAIGQLLLVGRMVKRLGERRAVMFGLLCATLLFAGYTVIRNEWVAFGMLLCTALQSVVQPSLMAMMSKRVAANQQGELQGMNASIGAMAAILGPFLLAQPLAYFTGAHAPFYFPGAAFAFSTVMGLVTMMIIAMTPKADPRLA